MDKNYVGKYICAQREKLGKTIREMASELNITPSRLSDVEKGNSLPTLALVQLIEKTYSVDCSSCIEFLLRYQDKQNKKPVKKEMPPVVQICFNKDGHLM